MKIFDCFTYFNEDLVLDIRLNILNKFVDYFVIVEANKTHSGKTKKKLFDIKKFSKFKNKIIYLYVKNMPTSENCWELENFQRNQILTPLKVANDRDLILISDVDEIPDLKQLDLSKNYHNKIIIFEQKCFYYKINLLNPLGNPWYGTKLITYKYLKNKSPQEIRSHKFKQYPFWRVDKPRNPIIIKNGGWHFSFLNEPKGIINKLKSYAHQEFNKKKINFSLIKKKINNLENVLFENEFLKKVHFDNSFPNYLRKNKKKYKKWIV